MDTISTTSEEVWKAIPNYEGLYEVSNLGRVRSFHNNTIKVLNPLLSSNGYYMVCLYKDSFVNRNCPIHSLVMLSFEGDRQGFVIDHINENKLDNRYENLEYVTKVENELRYLKNRKKEGKFTSKYVGVSRIKGRKKCWLSQIKINRKFVRLGAFYSQEEAHEAREKYIKENNLIR